MVRGLDISAYKINFKLIQSISLNQNDNGMTQKVPYSHHVASSVSHFLNSLLDGVRQVRAKVEMILS